MRNTSPLVGLALIGLWTGCSEPDPTTRAIKTLSGFSKVYVPIEAASLLSLQSALEDKGYGNVMAGDLKRQFVYSEASFGIGLVAYSSEAFIPESALFEPMSVTQWLTYARDDAKAMGVVLDPDSASTVKLTKAEIGRALAELPAQPDIPMELRH
jgi:hypothetical protein